MQLLLGSEQKALDFMSGITKEDKVVILAHNDLDGLISALITERAFGNAELIKFLDYTQIKSVKEEIIKINPSKIIFLDLNLHQSAEMIKELEKISDILILDHHKSPTDFNSEKTVHLLTDQKYPVSLISYLLFDKDQKNDLLAAVATIGDYCFKENIDFISNVESKYHLKSSEDIWTSEIGKIVKMLGNSEVYFKDHLNDFYKLLKDFHQPADIKGFTQYSEIIDKEVERIIQDFLKNRKTYSWGYFYNLESQFKISSNMVSMLSGKEKDKIFLFYGYQNNFIKVTTRRSDKGFDCSNLLKEATKDIPGAISGGHIPAAGAYFDKEYFGKFKSSILKILGE